MLKYIISIILLLFFIRTRAQVDSVRSAIGIQTVDSLRPDQTPDDTVALLDSVEMNDSAVAVDSVLIPLVDTTTSRVPDKDSIGQIRFGFDIGKLLLDALSEDSLSARREFGFELDYYFKNEIYFVLEAGWGSGSVDYPDLKYSSSNSFFKLGINKNILLRVNAKDWDQAFIGVRYAVGFIRRSDAFYETPDIFWGSTTGTIPGRSITGHWFELTGGTRLEIYKGLFVGWNARGRFRLNRAPFQELPPYFIAGYGKGDKNAIFDFNLFISYAIRWARQ